VSTPVAVTYNEKHLELLKAASHLFAERGYHDASIRDLAETTGRSLAGLYYYFSGKEELLFQIQHHCYSTLLATVEEALAEATDPRERLIIFVSRHISFFRHNMDEMKVLAHEDVTLTGEFAARILTLKRTYSKLLIDILAVYARENPSPNRPPAELAAFLLFGAMNWLYTWPHRVRELPAEKLAESVLQIFFCGYQTCPAAALTGIRESLSCAPRPIWREEALE
jgi:TetR/AcrR family transcriptional regulator, cholesterol catabolism regulator